MNRNLLYFSLILILVGLFFGIYLFAFLGFILLIPALFTTSRPPARPSPSPAKQTPRRITSPAEKVSETVAPPSQSAPAPMPAAEPSAAMPQLYSPALFPAPLMPSLLQMGMWGTPQATKEVPHAKQEGRDELLEMGAILVLLKLASG